MLRSAFTFRNAMCAVGVGHELEDFPVLYQLIDKHFGIRIMNIIIAGAVYI
jgi:hypothetical protein